MPVNAADVPEDLPFTTAIIPAAGDSSRMGGEKRKPWLPLGGEPMVLRTVRLLKSVKAVEEIILAVHPDDLGYAQDVMGEKLEKAGVTLVIAGGATREETVRKALEVTDPMCEIVAVHDAARPFADRSMCDALCKMARDFGAAIPVTPVTDTIKRVHADKVTDNVRRLGLMAAQTPQCFRRQLLIEAFAYADNTGGVSENVTDDSSLVEAYGHEVRCILGNAQNFKITTKEDLQLAELMLKAGMVERVL